MLDRPYADGDREDRDEDEGDEDQCPEVPVILEVVAREHFKDQQQQLQEQADDHGLVVHLAIALVPVLWMRPPHVAAHHGSNDDHKLPDPEGKKHDPVVP